MNLTAIPPDALNRFRHAASLLTQDANSRASRLLILKEEIATLRNHGVSYRSISDLLTQNGISTSDVSVMKFCHRFLQEKRQRQSSANRRPANRANPASSPKTAPVAPAQITPPPVPAVNPKPMTVPVETTAFTSRGPRIGTIRSLESIVQGFEVRAARLETDIKDSSKRANELEAKVGSPFEKEDRYHHLVKRQSEIEEKLDLTKNQAPIQAESSAEDETEEKISPPHIHAESNGQLRRAAVQI